MTVLPKSLLVSGILKEKIQLILFLFMAFFYGFILFLLSSFPFAFFLSFFDGVILSYFITASATIAMIFGIVYAKIQQKLNLKTSVKIQYFIFSIVMGLVLFCSFFVSQQLAAQLFILLMMVLTNVNYVAYANTLAGIPTLDFSKKYFGMIAGFVSLGKLLGISGLPFVLQAVGNNGTLSLLLVGEFFLILGNLLLILLFYNGKKVNKKASNKQTVYLREPLAIAAFVGFLLIFIMNNIWNLSFYDVVTKNFKTAVVITGFICKVNLIQTVLEFIVGYFFLSTLIKKLGVAKALLLNAISALCVAFLTLIFFKHLPFQSLIVGGIAPGLVTYFALSGVVFLSVANLTFIPMQEGLRSWTNTMTTMVFCPLGIAVGGVLFSLIYKEYGFAPRPILLTLLGITAVTVVIMKFWEKFYLKKLDQALERSIFFSAPTTLDYAGRAMILKKFNAGTTKQRLFLLEVVKNQNPKVLDKFISSMFEASDEEKSAALEVISEKKLSQFVGEILKLPVSTQQLKCLKLINQEEFESKIDSLLTFKETAYFSYVLKEALSLPSTQNKGIAIWKRLKQEDPSLALKTMNEEMKIEELPWIMDSLRSSDTAIQEEALLALPLNELQEEWNTLMQLIERPAFKNIFIRKLLSSEKEGLAFLSRFKELNQSTEIKQVLLSYIESIQSIDALKFLVSFIETEQKWVLVQKGIEILGNAPSAYTEIQIPKELIRQFVKKIAAYLNLLSKFDNISIFKYEERKMFTCLGYLWGIQFKSLKIPEMLSIYLSSDSTKKAYAEEILFYSLDEEGKRVWDQLKRHSSQHSFDLYHALFSHPLTSVIIKSYLCLEIGKNKLKEGLSFIQNIKNENHPVFLEAKEWVLTR